MYSELIMQKLAKRIKEYAREDEEFSAHSFIKKNLSKNSLWKELAADLFDCIKTQIVESEEDDFEWDITDDVTISNKNVLDYINDWHNNLIINDLICDILENRLQLFNCQF